MTQEFIILTVETSLIDKKIIVTTNNDIDPNSINDIHIEIMERDTRAQVSFTKEIKKNVLEITLVQWPIPNTSYICYVKSLKNILGEETRSGIRRKIEFKSSITKEVEITSPSMHEHVKELTMTYKIIDRLINAATDNTEDLDCYIFTEVSTDNEFINIVKSSKVYDKIEFTLSGLKPGQYFTRARMQNEEGEDLQYSKWSKTISFKYGDPDDDECIPEEDNNYLPDIDDDMAPEIDDEAEFTIECLTQKGTTPNEIVFMASKPILDFDMNKVIVTGKNGLIRTVSTVAERVIVIKILQPLKDNQTYDIKLLSLKSVYGDVVTFDISFPTKMKPLYCDIEAITSLIGEFKIPDNVILYHIREASKFADYLASSSLYPFEIDEEDVPFIVTQLVKYYAAHECLLRHTVDLSSSSGVKGVVGNVTFEDRETTKDISSLLKHFCDEIDKWKDAVKGYENEGRARMTSGVRGRFSSPAIQPLGINSMKSYGRGDLYGR